MPQFEVSFFSQYVDLGHHEWRARGCGIASLAMVMDFWHGQNGTSRTASLDELLTEGLGGGAYMDGVGWTHRGLVNLAAIRGYESFNVDMAPNSPTPATPDQAWASLLGELEKGPVLASVWRYMEPEPHGGHMVVVTGWDGQLVAFNDPMELTESEGRKLLSLSAFQRLFRQRYIVLRPSS